MPNVLARVVIKDLRTAKLGREKAIRIDQTQRLELVVGRRRRHVELLVEIELESRIVLYFLAIHTRVECQDLHPARPIVESEYCKFSDHAPHAAGRQAGVTAGCAATNESRTGYEIDML